ncbi:MAG TPA: hypothetical protein VFU17_07505 [Candidatus Limnocylindrales bacterium]|nr:hypothetical protein [Candidatus Limnocylindrales bacterium]
MLAARFAPDTRTAVRHTAALLAGAVALIYLLIGLQVMTVIDNPGDQAAFALPAAVVFGGLAGLLAVTDRRVVWGAAAVFVGLVILMYFGVAPRRSPQYETWGIALRLLQVPLVAMLGYLAVRPRTG